MATASASIIFGTFDDAKAAERDLRSAGFRVEILDEVDVYSNATWIESSRQTEATEEEINRIIRPYRGLLE